MKFVTAVVALSLFAIAAAQNAKSIECPAGEVVIKGVCGKCPKGKYYDEYSLVCTKCQHGSFQSTEGIQERCRDCPPNAYSMDGASKCISCPEGKVLKNNKKCGTCPPGTFYDEYDGFRCKKCPANTFHPYDNVEGQCLACSGDTNSDKGATKCTQCPAGTALMKNGKCGMCPPGTYYNGEKVQCVKCEVDWFQPYKNVMRSCLNCAGDSHSAQGATKCTKCPQGQALMKNGKCGTCPPGYQYYLLACQKCFINYFKRGNAADDAACKECPAGSFAAPGSSECFTCPFGEAVIITNKKANCGSCKPGFYYEPDEGKCFDCFEGSISPGGLVSLFECRQCKEGTVPNADRSACV